MRQLSRLVITVCILLVVLSAFGAYTGTEAAATKTPPPTKTPKGGPTSASTAIGTLALTIGNPPKIALIDTDGQNFKILADFPRIGFKVVWSPDGKHLAFTSEVTLTSGRQLMLTDGNGSNPQQITKGTASVDDFAWRPDSIQITIVTSTGASGPYAITNVDVETGAIQPLFTFNTKLAQNLRWSPDG